MHNLMWDEVEGKWYVYIWCVISRANYCAQSHRRFRGLLLAA